MAIIRRTLRLISVIFNVILHDKLKDDIEPYEVGQAHDGFKIIQSHTKIQSR